MSNYKISFGCEKVYSIIHPYIGMVAEISTPEKVNVALWSHIAHVALKEALFRIESKFEHNPDHYPSYLWNLDYHRKLHTQGTERGTVTILDTARFANPSLLTLKDVVCGRISASFHDPVQNWTKENGKRKRATGPNEWESAEMAVEFLRKINRRYGNGKDLFTVEDEELVRNPILATEAGFKDGTVVQPLLTSSSHINTKALCMSDVNRCLIDGPEVFIPEGDALFREDNIDIMVALKEKGVKNLTQAEMKEFRDRMLRWLEEQIVFVRGREMWLESDLSGIPEPAKSEVRKLFVHGEDSKAALRQAIAERTDLSFANLVQEFGYILRPSVEALP